MLSMVRTCQDSEMAEWLAKDPVRRPHCTRRSFRRGSLPPASITMAKSMNTALADAARGFLRPGL